MTRLRSIVLTALLATCAAALATVTITPGAWDLVNSGGKVASYSSQDACTAAAKALGDGTYACNTSTAVVVVVTGSAVVSWQSSTTLADGTPSTTPWAGHRVYYGTTSGQPVQSVYVPSPGTQTTITGLKAGVTWYFAVTAVDAAGIESATGYEVSKVVLPDPGT